MKENIWKELQKLMNEINQRNVKDGVEEERREAGKIKEWNEVEMNDKREAIKERREEKGRMSRLKWLM